MGVTPGDENFLGQPWEGLDKVSVPSSKSAVWVSTCVPLGLWQSAFYGLMVPVVHLGIAGAGDYLGFPLLAIVTLCSFECVQMSFYHITRHLLPMVRFCIWTCNQR